MEANVRPDSSDPTSPSGGSPKKGVSFREKADGEVAVSFCGAPISAVDEEEFSESRDRATPSAPPPEPVEEYQYDPAETGETWDIYKQRSVIEKVDKRKSEDAVLIKAKLEAALRAKAVAESVFHASAGLHQVASVGRTKKGRTAIVQTESIRMPTDAEISEMARKTIEGEDEDLDSSDDDKKNDSKEENDANKGDVATEADVAPAPQAAQTPALSPQPASAAPTPAPAAAPTESGGSISGSTHTLEALQNGTPPGVLPNEKENFLREADFQIAFKMSKEEFIKMPNWKKQAAKKAAKLF